MKYFLILAIALLMSCQTDNTDLDTTPAPLQILFLGHDSRHHNSYEYAPILMRKWTREGIQITYTEDPDDLTLDNLSLYDGVILYANHDSITAAQETALLDYVRSGKGFIPIHCASYCFRNSDEVVDMIGGQFMSHDTGTFTAQITDPDHPIMIGITPFSTWDETYVHTKIADDIHILMERVEGDHREPWTWVKEEGRGRVFYTAFGHDERTWNNPGFLNLLKNGILWAVGDHAHNLWAQFRDSLPKFVYHDTANIPNYEKRDPWPQYQEPFTPEESRKLIQVPVGFHLELFASEPDIINPVSMAWDEKGRLWVIETVDYPNTVREDKSEGDDRIKICEDTDGDGRADKFTIFAENLNIPTSLVFVNGGILISQAPEFIFLADTDGDDVADVREVIMEGWGTFDTHAGPSNLQYGMDNYIWGVVGYSGFRGTIGGEEFQLRQGIYRFDRDYGHFSKMGNTSNNTWGLGFTETGEVFASTANNTHSVYMGIPNSYFEDVKGLPNRGSMKIDGHYPMRAVTDHVRQVDVFGGYTAASGHHFYTARTYPEKYWTGHALVAEPTGHLVHWAQIVPEGGGFTEKDGGNIVAGADEWFAPVEAKVGPDGNVWIADWYNFIVQHNPTPEPDFGGYQAETGDGNAYINPLRDREHGRIWRIVPDGYESQALPTLDPENPDELVNTLKHPNLFWRMTAQRLLVERGETDLAEDLIQLVSSAEVDATGNAPAALHAMWSLDGLGLIDGNHPEALDAVAEALDHEVPAVRKAAIRILSGLPEGKTRMQEAEIWNDQDPVVQVAALLEVSTWEPSDELGSALYLLSQDKFKTSDPWLGQALHIASAQHRKGFIKSFVQRQGAYVPIQTEDEQALTWTQRFLNSYWDDSAEDLADEVIASAGDVQEIKIGVIQNEMKYDISEFVVEAGHPVEITFVNNDFMQHNLLICTPGSLEKVGKASDQMAMQPDGAEKHYVPDLPEVLNYTRLINPEESTTLRFIAPEEPGDYPFICTFPGHWRLMNGVMKVVTKSNI